MSGAPSACAIAAPTAAWRSPWAACVRDASSVRSTASSSTRAVAASSCPAKARTPGFRRAWRCPRTRSARPTGWCGSSGERRARRCRRFPGSTSWSTARVADPSPRSGPSTMRARSRATSTCTTRLSSTAAGPPASALGSIAITSRSTACTSRPGANCAKRTPARGSPFGSSSFHRASRCSRSRPSCASCWPTAPSTLTAPGAAGATTRTTCAGRACRTQPRGCSCSSTGRSSSSRRTCA